MALAPREPLHGCCKIINHLSEFSQQIVDSNPAIGTFLSTRDDSGTPEVKGVVVEDISHHSQDIIRHPLVCKAIQREELRLLVLFQ